jgi:hypothetical protein
VTQWTQWWNGNQWIECKFIDNNTWTIIQSRSLGRDNSISFDQERRQIISNLILNLHYIKYSELTTVELELE